MDHVLLFINSTPESFLLSYIMTASDLLSTTPGPSLNEMIKVSQLPLSEIKCLYQYTHTNEEIMNMREEAKALTAH
jgi:hypothetical protein